MEDLFPAWGEKTLSPLPEEAFRGKTVLLTGAGGSLGAALARQLASLPVERLVLVDTSEHGLTGLKEGLEGLFDADSQTEVPATEEAPATEYVLADLRLRADRRRCLRGNPKIVIHAAAYKHVPFLEGQPIAAAQNNLLATASWFACCQEHPSVKRFAFVSTDKAVAPEGVMGATKALAEAVIRANSKMPGSQPEKSSGDSTERGSSLTATIIRLCNVFGSRGSVVPRFWRRLQEGKPLPVTHPKAERWFISPEAAACCVLQALCQEPCQKGLSQGGNCQGGLSQGRPSQGGSTYVPNACREVSILRLARRMVRRAYPSASPDEWIEIVGLRAGEQLSEDLLAPAECPVIQAQGDLLRARSRRWPQIKEVEAFLDRVRELCEEGESEIVRDELREATSGLTMHPTEKSFPAM